MDFNKLTTVLKLSAKHIGISWHGQKNVGFVGLQGTVI